MTSLFYSPIPFSKLSFNDPYIMLLSVPAANKPFCSTFLSAIPFSRTSLLSPLEVPVPTLQSFQIFDP